MLHLTGTELRERLAAGDALIGEWEAAAGDLFDDMPLYHYPPAARLRRAGFLAELAWARLREAQAAGKDPRQAFPPEAIRPIYSAPEERP